MRSRIRFMNWHLFLPPQYKACELSQLASALWVSFFHAPFLNALVDEFKLFGRPCNYSSPADKVVFNFWAMTYGCLVGEKV